LEVRILPGEPDRTLFELETEAVGAGNATDSQVGVVVEFG